MDKRWKPRRRGAVYCSSACGSQCTYEDFLTATKRCKHLLSIMKSGGWKSDVWENMGWHYALRHTKLDISLHPSYGAPPKYFLCGLVSLVGGISHMNDPNALVDVFMRHLRHEATALQKAQQALKNK